MKQIIALMLVLVMCIGLCACGGAKLTVDDVEGALKDLDGTLDMVTSGNKVESFTYVVEDVNAGDLVDKSFAREAIVGHLSGNALNMTYGQFKVASAFTPLMEIDALLSGDEDDFDSDAYIEKLLGIVCDGNTAEYDGWKVSADVDQSSDSMTISVSK